MIHHAGAPTDKGVKVVDIWETADKFNEFGQALMPILNKHGVKEPKPVILPLHYEYNNTKSAVLKPKPIAFKKQNHFKTSI